jgi:hypothetical protein
VHGNLQKCDKECPRQESKSKSYVHKIKDSDGAKMAKRKDWLREHNLSYIYIFSTFAFSHTHPLEQKCPHFLITLWEW